MVFQTNNALNINYTFKTKYMRKNEQFNNFIT